MKIQNLRTIAQIVGLLLLASVLNLRAASGTWTNDAAGNWSGTANWLNGIVADATGNTADFSTINITADRTVTLDAAHTISTLKFGDLVPDHNWILSGSFTLTLGTTPQIYVANQAATISTVIAGSAGLTKTGPGALTLGGATDTYTGGTTINGGTLTLDYNASGSPTSTLIPSQVLTNAGGTLILNGKSGAATSQAFGALTLNAGAGAITLTPNGAASLTATLGTLNRPAAGTIVFNGPATIGANNVAVAATGTITATTAGEGGASGLGILCAGGSTRLDWGTVGLYDWASTFTTSGTAGTSPYTIIGGSQVPGFYTAAANGATTGNNIDFTLQQTPGTAGQQPTTIGNNYSMRFNSPHAPRGNTSGNVQTGGILVTPNLGTINAAMDAIRLINVSGLVQNNTAAVFVIGQFQSTGNPFVKSGAGTLFINPISGNNLAMNYDDATSTHTVVNYTGYNYTAMTASGNAPNPPYLNGGVTVINSTKAFACQASPVNTAGGNITVNLNGGTLLGDLNDVVLTNTLAASSPRNVYLGGNGGGLAADSGHTLSVPGVIADFTTAIPGALTIGISASAANGNVAGLVPGMGGSSDNTAIYGTGTVDLSTGANTYTGGTILQTGTAKINGINNLGGSGTYGGLTFNGGTLQYAAGATGYGSLDISSGTGITLLAGGGTVDLNGNTMTYSNAIGNGGSGALTVASTTAGGVLNLSGANTYTGGTTINSGATLNVNNTSGSGTGSGNVTVNGTLGGSGIIAGDVTVQTGGQTLPGSSGATNTISGNLTYNTGASNNFVLGATVAGGGNDQIILNGAGKTLTFTGTSTNVGINCGSTLDQAHDYVLFSLTGSSSPTISGTLNPTPTWLASTPAGSAYYSVIVTNSTNVVLHYSSPNVPPVVATTNVSPNPVLANQALTISATVTPGTGTIDPNTGVKVNLSTIGGSATQALISDGAGNYTNTVIVSGSAMPGAYTLVVAVLDSLGGAASANISLTVGSSVAWNGADATISSNWSDGANWVAGVPPGSAVNILFVGSAGLTPVLDSSRNVASATFDTGAGAFNLINAGGSVLTLTSSVTNNSANTQTLSLPVAVSGTVTLNAAANNLVVNGVVSGGALIAAGANLTTLTATNTYTGSTTVNANSTLAIGVAGELGSGTYAGTINNNGTFAYNSSAAQAFSGSIVNGGVFIFNSTNAQTVSGAISGAGALMQQGTNTLTLSGTNTYTGPTTITNNSTLLISGSGSLNSGSYAGNITNNGTLIDQSSVGQTLSGIISGTGSNVWNSTAGLSLNGANTYSGGTYLNEGTLTMNTTVACIGSGPVILGSNGYSGIVTLLDTLGSGTFTNALIVNPGGTREIYNSSGGSLNWGGLITLTGGATLQFGPNNNNNQTISGGTAGNGTLDICYPQSARNTTIIVTGGAVNHVGTLENTMSGTTGTAQINAAVGPNVTNVLQNSSCPMNLTATNTYAGFTTILQGKLALSGSGSISNSTAIIVAGNAIFDVSGLTSTFVLNSSQTLSNSTSTAILNGNINDGGTNSLTYADGTPALTITNGTLTIANNSVFIVNNTGAALALGSHKLISEATGGSVVAATTLPAVTVTGGGTVGGATLSIISGELYLNVLTPTTLDLASSAQTNGYLASLTFTATVQSNGVAAGDAVGTVIFQTNGVPFSTNTISTGGSVTSPDMSSLPRGTNIITAIYSDDSNYMPSMNSLSQIVTNHPPVAAVMTVTRTAGLALIISLSDVATNWTDNDSDPVSLTGVTMQSTNGVNLFALNWNTNFDGSIVTTNAYAFIGYTNSPNVADQISYSISDGQGGTNIGYVNIEIQNSVTGTNSITGHDFTSPYSNTVTAYGIPNFYYILERATNLTSPVWVDVQTNQANATNGIIKAADTFWDLGGVKPNPSAYYQLKWQP